MEKVTVIIPTHKRPERVAQAVKSVLSQGDCLGEVIVIDDNRDEAFHRKTKTSIESIEDPKIKYIRNTRTKGESGARNSGILCAKYDYICFLDDDDELFSNALVNQLEAFQDPGLGMVYGIPYIVDEIYGIEYTGYFNDQSFLSYEDLLNGQCPSSTSTVMVRRDALIEAGLFDESMRSFNDWDLWLRISKNRLIKRHSNCVAKYVVHNEERTSIDFSHRFSGLDYISEKWKREIEEVVGLSTFRNYFISQAYFQNGKVLLSRGLQLRLSALYYLCLSGIYAPFPRLKFSYFLRFFSGMMGFSTVKLLESSLIYIRRFRTERRRSSSNTSHYS